MATSPEDVRVNDFGATGLGLTDDAPAFAAAFLARRRVYVPKGDYLVGATIPVPDGRQITLHPEARLFANSAMASLLTLGNNCEVAGGIFDCNNTKGATSVNADGANIGIRLANVSDCRITAGTFKKYRNGIRAESTIVGRNCSNHKFLDNTFDGYYTWLQRTPDPLQVGIYLGSTATGTASLISAFAPHEVEANDVSGFVLSGNHFIRGQYGVAMHRASGASIARNRFERMSRGISIQHQSRGFSVVDNTFRDLMTSAVAIAQGSSDGVVAHNNIQGSAANDNTMIQASYGVNDIVIDSNTLDSRFGEWAGGPNNEARAPENGIRIGQYAKRITITRNTIRGYRVGIIALSTIYPEVIKPTMANYFTTGLQGITIAENQIEFTYENLTATPTKLALPQANSYGIWIHKSGSWEDVAQGGIHLRNISISGNTVRGTRYPYVIQKAGNTAANPAHFRDVWITDNHAHVSGSVDNIIYVGTDSNDTIYGANNPWKEIFTPSLSGSRVAGSHTYTMQSGHFLRNGKMIQFSLLLSLGAKDAAMSGNAEIGGLPFPAAAAPVIYQAVDVALSRNFKIARLGQMAGYILPGSSRMMLKNGSGASSSVISSSDCGLVQLSIAGSYVID